LDRDWSSEVCSSYLKEGKSDEFISDEDIFKPFMNPEVNISSFFGQDKYAMVNYLDMKSINAKIVPLSAWMLNEGVYTMSFTQIDGFNSDINIYLKDNYKNTITDLRVNDTYAFNVDAQKESTQDGRLELIFVNKTSSLEYDSSDSPSQTITFTTLLSLMCAYSIMQTTPILRYQENLRHQQHYH
jgi:hypothetical protein